MQCDAQNAVCYAFTLIWPLFKFWSPVDHTRHLISKIEGHCVTLQLTATTSCQFIILV